ncbi:GTPases - Sulfate adenylate transferase subunit 1 [Methanosarcina sp. Kolksee]|uniref:C39 family peptidase n=1 Tax=Methanosarcina sp. Kolksee TaxID=1434099 RepID=UPI0006155D07|nr:C39 family peptidase [Methanosarcina sp. Kolksee]AKB48652.1 GTPases - Sulfate adenylate transferase subunit 1 [Methanosarcina sp. Kolksee]
MIKKQFGIVALILVILLVGITLIPAVSAQKEDNYSVTAEDAFKHANANMISFIAAKAPNFEDWTGASIDPKPIELYDINGQKLFYQFSVYKEKKLIGTIDIYANKKLGNSFNDIAFDPEPYKTTEAIKKSKDIAKKNYPTGEIKSTSLVVYNYPSIGAMTVVKDKTTGFEHRIFVDAYTLEKVEDKPVTETEPGVWSMYEMKLENGVEENLKEWQESDQLTKYIEQAAANKGVNINAAVTEENMKKLSADAATTTSTSIKLGVLCRGQECDIYCGEASIQMISLYYGRPTPKQTSIYKYFFDSNDDPAGLNPSEIIEWANIKWGKTGTLTSSCTSSGAVTEINKRRPFFSMTSNHYRVCQGYLIQNGYYYMYINDPLPVGSSGTPKIEKIGNGTERKRIYIR